MDGATITGFYAADKAERNTFYSRHEKEVVKLIDFDKETVGFSDELVGPPTQEACTQREKLADRIEIRENILSEVKDYEGLEPELIQKYLKPEELRNVMKEVKEEKEKRDEAYRNSPHGKHMKRVKNERRLIRGNNFDVTEATCFRNQPQSKTPPAPALPED